jgi:hypothetical protein
MANKERQKLFDLFKSLNKEDRQKIINRGEELKAEENKKAEQKKEETRKREISNPSRTEDRYVRVIFRFSSSGRNGSQAHAPLYIQAIIDGLKSDSDELYNILYRQIQDKYGEAVVETGKFSIEHIPYPQYENYQIRYRRSENENWKIWR